MKITGKQKNVMFVFILFLLVSIVIYCGYKEHKVSRIPKIETGVEVYGLEEEIRNILGYESVSITTGAYSGSGILWYYDGKEMIVVTTAHLFLDSFIGELELWSGNKVKFDEENVKIWKDQDIAVIYLNAEKEWKQKKSDISKNMYQESLQIGDNVWLVESSYGPASGLYSGSVYASKLYVEDYGMEMLLLSGKGIKGMSGCPVYDIEGRLVAMMSGMSEDGGILAAIPVNVIYDKVKIRN